MERKPHPFRRNLIKSQETYIYRGKIKGNRLLLLLGINLRKLYIICIIKNGEKNSE